MPVSLLGVRIDEVTMDQARDRVRNLLLSGNRDFVVTPNPEFIVRARRDAQFRDTLNQASLSVPDGVGLVWAGRILGQRLPERVAGADLAEESIRLASELGKSVFFVGGRGGSGARAAEKMSTRYPGLRVAGVWEGSGGEEGDVEAIKAIGSDRIGLILVAFGHPKQELWISRNRDRLNFNLAMGVGGTFDYWSGQVARAPRLFQHLGLEWLYRLVRQPWRWHRQLDLLSFIWLVGKEKLSKSA